MILGLWDKSIQTIAITICASLYCLIIGIPIGIFVGENKKLENIIMPVLAWMQTTPSFVYLIAIVLIFGMGFVPGIVATMLFSLPSSIRLTALGIKAVSIDAIEAGLSIGCNQYQIIWRIKIPQAMPSIMTGVNQTIMMALSMIVIASLIGAPGLGLTILSSLGSVNIGDGIDAGICVIIVAYLLDQLTSYSKLEAN
jgi:glycine betaine/proline transport system permease protein